MGIQQPDLVPWRPAPDGGRLRSPLRRCWPMGDRSGQVMALFAIAAVPLMAMLALAIDVSMLLTARAEAQRAAGAGALAGAAMFRGCSPVDCVTRQTMAHDTAEAYAMKNRIRKLPITSDEVTVQVMPDEKKVRVFVDRDGVPTFFAHLLGVPVAPIGAVAAAMVSSGGTGQCMMPFFGPDLWDESNDPDRIPEVGEEELWSFDPNEDTYDPLGKDKKSGTGYGSEWRDGRTGSLAPPDPNADPNAPYFNDYGRRIVLSSTSQGANQGSEALGSAMSPGNFQLWSVPIPGEDLNGDGQITAPEDCDPENPTYAQGGKEIRDLLSGDIPCSCPVGLGEQFDLDTEEFQTKPGETWGNVKQGLQDRIAADDTNASYDPSTKTLSCTIDGTDFTGTDCYGSTRVVPIAISNPGLVVDLNGRSTPITFNNVARIFIDDQFDNTNKIIYGFFLGFAPGGGGPETGNLIEYLRLVE